MCCLGLVPLRAVPARNYPGLGALTEPLRCQQKGLYPVSSASISARSTKQKFALSRCSHGSSRVTMECAISLCSANEEVRGLLVNWVLPQKSPMETETLYPDISSASISARSAKQKFALSGRSHEKLSGDGVRNIFICSAIEEVPWRVALTRSSSLATNVQYP